MKRNLLILGFIFCLTFSVHALYNNGYYYNNYGGYYPYNNMQRVYCNQPPIGYSIGYNTYNRVRPYPVQYNNVGYNPYLNQYYYKKANKNNIKRIKRLEKIKKIKKRRYNTLTLNSNNNGNLTGYSVSIKDDILNQFNFKNQNKNNTLPQKPVYSYNDDLYSNPTTNEFKSSRGFSFKDGRETGATSGVTIIYD